MGEEKGVGGFSKGRPLHPTESFDFFVGDNCRNKKRGGVDESSHLGRPLLPSSRPEKDRRPD